MVHMKRVGYREIEMGFIRLLFTTIHKTISEFTDKLCQFSNNCELTVAQCKITQKPLSITHAATRTA